LTLWKAITTMNDIDEGLRDLVRRDLSHDELEAVRAATPISEDMDRRKLKRIQRNAILAVRRTVTRKDTAGAKRGEPPWAAPMVFGWAPPPKTGCATFSMPPNSIAGKRPKHRMRPPGAGCCKRRWTMTVWRS
jgi:hypothetical protein